MATVPEVQVEGTFRRRDAVRLVVALGLLLAGITAILASDILAPGVTVRVGDVAPEIRAPRAIIFESQIQTDEARRAAREAVPPQYDYEPIAAETTAGRQVAAFRELVGPVDAIFAAPYIDEARRNGLNAVLPDLTPDSRRTLVGLTGARWSTIREEAARVLALVERAELRDSNLAEEQRLLGVRFGGDLDPDERELAAEIITPLVVPNSTYSEALTEQERERAAQAVAPVRRSIRQGEVIVDLGHQVTELDMEALIALGLDQPRFDLARIAGWFLFSLVLATLLLAWVWSFRRELWHRANTLLLVGLVLVATVIVYKLTAGRSIVPFFVPVAAVGMLLTVLLDAGVATLVLAFVAVLAGALNASSLEMTTYAFLGGFAGILAVRRGDRLQVFVQAGLAVGLVSAAVVTIFSLLGERDLTGILQLWAATGISAAGSAVLAAGSFAVLGNVFGILTAFQLLELANPTQPLLRRLLVETPGTYHHSLMVGNLAERAAEAIGADPLLSRVAAYYHDIGKLANPLAFIENQSGAENIHDQLDPEVSAHILKQHVPDGIEIAYRARLPKPLIAFIPQHHGTAVISFFYAKALDEAAASLGGPTTIAGREAAAAVDEHRFRHAGPKPQTREAALIMLADGIEASVRSLDSHDEAAIRAMVARIISERLEDGQFDQCDLTLRDLEQVREAFTSTLMGMYHRRIAYPQSKVVELETRREASSSGGSGRT